MDDELRQYLDRMKAELRQEIGSQIRESEQRTVALIVSVKESLEREMGSLKGEMKQVRASQDRIEARLAKPGGLIQGGARQVARLVVWSEDINQILAERDGRLEDLTRRLEKLEGQQGS